MRDSTRKYKKAACCIVEERYFHKVGQNAQMLKNAYIKPITIGIVIVKSVDGEIVLNGF